MFKLLLVGEFNHKTTGLFHHCGQQFPSMVGICLYLLLVNLWRTFYKFSNYCLTRQISIMVFCFNILSGSWKPWVRVYLMKSSLVPRGHSLMFEIYENKKMLLLKGWCGEICGYFLSYLSFCPTVFKNV